MNETAAMLARRGHAVEVFTADDRPGYRTTPLRYLDSRPWRRALLDRLRSFAPDVVHLHNFYHVLSPGILTVLGGWRRRGGGRVVMTAHDYHLVCPNAGLRWFKRRSRPVLADIDRLQRLPYVLGRRWDHRSAAHALLKTAQHVWNYRVHDRRRFLDVVICPSRFMQSVLDRAGLPTVFLPSPAPAPVETGERPAGPLHLVFAGRLDPEKGVAEFLRALPGEFRGTVEIVGAGELETTCRTIVEERGLGGVVAFAGRLSREDTIRRIERAHVVVLPSRWYENAPVALFEALSRGASILVSDLGGMREIVEASGIGFTFDPDRPESLRDALGRIEHAHESGDLNRFDASPYLRSRSEEAYIDALLEVYDTAGA